MTNPTGSAGRGRLADVLATRGGRAEPEAPFVIEHREALIYMLCQAAEPEHGIMCQYLFAAFSLKQRMDEGLTPEELEAVTRPNLPAPVHHYPAAVSLTLVPLVLGHQGPRLVNGRVDARRAFERHALRSLEVQEVPERLLAESSPSCRTSRRSATCTARSSTVWRTSPRSSASATCSSGRHEHRRPAATSAGPTSWP